MRRLVLSLALVAILLPALAAPTRSLAAQSISPSDQQRITELVKRLGDPSFEVRTSASSQLMRLGLAIKPYLQAGTRDDDLEIRRRCLELLPAVMEADLQARIAVFLADKEGKKEHDLPGWGRFRKLAGDDPAARLLFAEIIKSEAGPFVAEAEAHPDLAGDMFAGRLQNLQQHLYNPLLGGRGPVSVSEVAALLFVASDTRVRVPLQSVYMLNNFFYQPSIRSALGAPASASPFKRLLVAWMHAQSDPNVVQQTLNLAMNLELKEALSLAVKIANDKTVRGHPLGLALTAVGKLGGKEHRPLLERFLDDTTLVGNFGINQVRGTTEIRDVALGMLVHVTGQSHRDYGFAFPQTSLDLKFNPFYLGFTNAAQRQAALKKWQGYTAKK
jgi:hypothetical protein